MAKQRIQQSPAQPALFNSPAPIQLTTKTDYDRELETAILQWLE